MQALVQQECLFVLGVVGVLGIVNQLFFALLERALDDQLVVEIGRGPPDGRLCILETAASTATISSNGLEYWLEGGAGGRTCTRCIP